MVGALVVPPMDPGCVAGAIFFNNVGTLGMCGHGTIGLAVTLGHLGRIAAGTHRLETPVAPSRSTTTAHAATIENVPAYRHLRAVQVDVPGYGLVTGDVAWGGNWFFLVSSHHQQLTLANIERLTDFTWRIRQALTGGGITGSNGGEIDHIELFGPPRRSGQRLPQFCAMPRQSLRPLSLRHGDFCEAGLPLCRRKAPSR